MPLLDPQREVAAVAVLRGDEVSLVVEGLSANELGTRYVLWEQGRAGGLQAIGSFDVPEGGVEVVEDLTLAYGRGGVGAFAITQEPERGRVLPTRPSTAPVASGAVERV